MSQNDPRLRISNRSGEMLDAKYANTREIDRRTS